MEKGMKGGDCGESDEGRGLSRKEWEVKGWGKG